MNTSPRTCTEHHFVTHDGEPLFYRHWPATGTRRGAIMLLHRFPALAMGQSGAAETQLV